MYPTRRDALRTGSLLAAGTLALAGCTAADPDAAPPTASTAETEPTVAATPTAEAEPTAAATTADATAATDAGRVATLHTTMGDVTVELYPDKVPETVENFVGLATGTRAWTDPETGETRTDPLYEDVLFHRVIDGFMIQGGDPTGTGRGGPGYTFDDEFHPDLRHDAAGVLSMANRGPDTNGSQFFVTLDATPHLDGRHAVFGRVVEGMAVVREIGAVPTDGADRPLEDVRLESIDVGR
jgi:peptidyl-prolyl cis-trans isomerase A (cyclophilin A)